MGKLWSYSCAGPEQGGGVLSLACLTLLACLLLSAGCGSEDIIPGDTIAIRPSLGATGDTTGTGGTGGASAVPQVASITPAATAPGQLITLSGSNFSSTARENAITFQRGESVGVPGRTEPVEPRKATTSTLEVTVPIDAITGKVIVTVGVQSSSGTNFTVIPSLKRLGEVSGRGGQPLSIIGSGYGLDLSDNTVRFAIGVGGGTVTTTPSNIEFSPNEEDTMTLTVPQGITPGTAQVTLQVGGNSSNSLPLTIAP